MEIDGSRRPYSKGQLIALCGGLVRDEFTGRLEIYHHHTSRVLMLIGGELVGMASDLSAESIEHQLLLDEVVTKGDISRVNGKSRHEGRTGDEMRVEEALLRRRRLSNVDLATTNQRRIEATMVAVFGLDGAEYSLFPHDKIGKVDGVGIQDGLVSTQSLLSAFWRPATRASEWIMGEVSKFQGPLSPSVGFEQAILDLEGVSFPLDRFRESMGRQPSVEELYLDFSQETSLFPLLWLLVNYGAITTNESVKLPKTERAEELPESGLGMQGSSQRSLEEWERLITETYEERVTLDCYGFIGSQPSATREEVDLACKDMLREFKPALMVQSMSEESFDKLDKLLIGVKNVWGTLADSVLRKEYDANLASGVKYRVACVPGAVPIEVQSNKSELNHVEAAPLSDRLKEALDKVGLGLFEEALPLLDRERLQNPNSAAVLTGIARSHFGLGRIDDSLDFFNLALVFSPSDYRGLRGVAEVHLRSENLDDALESLKALEEVHPLDEWVQAEIAKFDSKNNSEKRSLFSWGRKRK